MDNVFFIFICLWVCVYAGVLRWLVSLKLTASISSTANDHSLLTAFAVIVSLEQGTKSFLLAFCNLFNKIKVIEIHKLHH